MPQKPNAARPKTASEEARPHILATDDRPEVLRLVERALGDRYECEFATSVAEAREKLANEHVELALCDIQMSGELGLVFVEEIARQHSEVAIVMVTWVDDPETAECAWRLSAKGYLVKPLWPGQLRITAANALRQQRLEVAERSHRVALLETVERLVQAIEIHDPEAGRRVSGMAAVAALLGERLGLDAQKVMLLRAAAPMHDIGMVATPGGVRQKRDALTASERRWMEAHTTVGHRILAESTSDLLRMAATIALTHHERFDGKGYPEGVSGADIPLEGRIVAVADVFDTLLSDRPYRPASPLEEAVKLIADERGAHFDPKVVDALLDNLDAAVALRG